MRNLTLLLLIFFTTSLNAGGYYNYPINIDDYDPVTGLYYKSIEIKKKNKSFLSSGSDYRIQNINIFDPKTATTQLLFKDNEPRNIKFILFETGFKDNSIQFFSGASSAIKNNFSIAKRPIKNKLLIGLSDAESKTMTLWVADKMGKKLSRLVSIPFSTDWHIDVKNSKLRIIQLIEGKLSIKSYDW